MAESDRPGGEPTEPPSEKRLRDARRRGEVPRSRELTSLAVFAAGAAALAWTWPRLLGELQARLAEGLRDAPLAARPAAQVLDDAGRGVLVALLPVLGAVFVAALLASFVQVGALFTLHPLTPSLARLGPLANARHIFGRAALFELVKTLVKLLGFAAAALSAVWQQLPRLCASVGGAPAALLGAVGACLAAIAVRVALVAGAIALVDVMVQRRRHLRRLRMTRQEVQREQKESEGDPQHKAERRRLHQEILDHQMLEAVATADCVVINPTEVAVALRYDAEHMAAPKVVARGQRWVAAQIRAIARRHGIPVIRNVPLARALVELELDQEIPAEIYEAVAEVLRFVYELSGRSPA
jgi:flagellar biosynthesis protein FlhB